MKITKILPQHSTPAKPILDRAAHVALTSEERAHLPATIVCGEETLEVAIENTRPLEVGEVLLDEQGHFYVIEAAVEKLLMIKGDEELVGEAVLALVNRGIAVAQCDEGFVIQQDPALIKVLTMIGLEFEEVEMPFDPIRPKTGGSCGCGCGCGSDHHHGDTCGCGCGEDHHHHDHHHHHHHEHGESCGCGCGEDHHHHHHHEHHHHEHGETCGCGCGEEHHHHHHHEHHHHEHGETCDCGCGETHHHHHHHEKH